MHRTTTNLLIFAAALLTACDPTPKPTPEATTTTAPTATTAAAPPDTAPASPDTATTPPPTEPTAPHRTVHEVHAHLGLAAIPLAIELFDAEGIGRVVNLSGGYAGERLDANIALAHQTEGRIVPFFNIDWSRLPDEGENFGAAIAADLRDAVSRGAAGLKISKALGLSVPDPSGEGLLPVDAPILDPIFAAAGELGIPVSIHTSDPKAFFEPLTPENERYKELSLNPSWSFHDPIYPSRETLLTQRERRVARHPETTFILVHFANNPEDIAFVDRLLDAHPNANVDVSARLAEIGRHPPDDVRTLFIKHRKRILFGTDFMLHARGRRVSLTLGSISEDPLTRADVHTFFDLHWRYFEGSEATIPNPVPIQGDWQLYPIHLPADVLDDLYINNADRLVFGPWDARHAKPTTTTTTP